MGGRAVSLAESTGVRWDWLEATRALGLAALLNKDLPEAVSHLAPCGTTPSERASLDPGASPRP